MNDEDPRTNVADEHDPGSGHRGDHGRRNTLPGAALDDRDRLPVGILTAAYLLALVWSYLQFVASRRWSSPGDGGVDGSEERLRRLMRALVILLLA